MSENPEDIVNKAIEDIISGKVEEDVIWEKGKEPVDYRPEITGEVEFPPLSEKDLEDIKKMNAESVIPLVESELFEGKVLREHDVEDHEKCWCHEKYPMFAHGYEVGVAIPLANGDYTLQFNDNNVGRLVQTFVNMGALNSFSIVDGKGVLDLGEDDEADQEDPED